MKQGVIVVNHGTMNYDIRQKTIDEFILSIGDRIENADIVSVYTDGDVRRGLRESTGERVQNLKAAILAMKERGVNSLVVVSTDVHDGAAYRKLMDETVGLASQFQEVRISKPLIYSEEDYIVTARAVYGAYGDIVGDDILVLIAKGDKDYGSEELECFERELQQHIDHSYVASINGRRKLYRVIKDLSKLELQTKRLVLVPLEFMAGNGVENEVSQEYTVLADRLRSEGYEVSQQFRGIAEYDEFQRLYMRHLYDARR